MPEDTHPTELLPGYALGCLDRTDLIAAASHLAECASCQERLREYRELVGFLAEAVPPRDPPPSLRRRFMERLRSGPGGPGAERGDPDLARAKARPAANRP